MNLEEFDWRKWNCPFCGHENHPMATVCGKCLRDKREKEKETEEEDNPSVTS